MQGLIHYNPNLPHQIDHAQAFLNSGFAATPQPHGDADVHIVSGPWFAESTWRGHKRVLKIDRAWWGDPDCVSLGWLQPDGTRKYAHGSAPRPRPLITRNWKTREASCLILADYQQDTAEMEAYAAGHFATVQVRKHPTEQTGPHVPLETAIRLRDVVIGHSSTALFEAIMLGTPVICTDPTNACMPVCSAPGEPLYRGDREAWLHDMSYKQFSLAEIADGTAWNLLKDVQ